MHLDKLKIFLIFCIFIVISINFSYGEIDVLYRTEYISQPAISFLNPDNFLKLHSDLNTSLRFFFVKKEDFFDEKVKIKISNFGGIFPSNKETKLTNRVNEAYISFFPYEKMMITIGKEIMKTGVGYIKNPTDYMGSWDDRGTESKELFEKYREGTIALDIQFLLNLFSIQTVFVPNISWKTGQIWDYLSKPQKKKIFFRVDGNIYGLDIAPVVLFDSNWHGGINLAYVIGNNIEIHSEMSVSKKVTKKILVEEKIPHINTPIASVNMVQEREIKWPYISVTGGHYTLPEHKLTIMLEYLYNGRGLSVKEWKNTLDLIEKSAKDFHSTDTFSLLSFYNIKNIVEFYNFCGFVQHYGILRISKELENGFSLELIILQNLVDRSCYMINRIGHRFENAYLESSIEFPYRKNKSEFGLVTDICRIRFGMTFFF